MSRDVPNVPLNDGVAMPQLGFGVWQVPADDATQVVLTALETGYRSIDTAAIYGNDGRVRAVGVSNFQVAHLDRLAEETGVVPALNQVELHPRLPQAELRAAHAERGIVTEAWSPLARGGLLDDHLVGRLAQAHGRTPAQVVLRWHVQLGNVVIPKSVTPSRIRENLDVFDFVLSDEDMQALSSLETGERTGPHPDRFVG